MGISETNKFSDKFSVELLTRIRIEKIERDKNVLRNSNVSEIMLLFYQHPDFYLRPREFCSEYISLVLKSFVTTKSFHARSRFGKKRGIDTRAGNDERAGRDRRR